MSDTEEVTPAEAPPTTVVTIAPESVRASLKQTGHLPGWVSDAHTVNIAPGEGGAFVVTVEGEAPIAPAPEPAPPGE